jgi:hypothetical protein
MPFTIYLRNAPEMLLNLPEPNINSVKLYPRINPKRLITDDRGSDRPTSMSLYAHPVQKIEMRVYSLYWMRIQ